MTLPVIRNLVTAWDSFWFTPASPLPMAVFRILIGLAALELLLGQLAPEFFTWFGTNGITEVDTLRAHWPGAALDLFLLLPEGNFWLALAFGFLVISAVALTIGLFTRFSAAIVFIGLSSLFHHNPLVLQGPERLLFLALIFVSLSNAGRALSIDNLLAAVKNGRGDLAVVTPLYSQWAQRLVQVELSLLYLQCVVSKLSGEFWRDGTAVYYTSRIQSMFRIDVPYVFDHIWTIKLLTWGTIGIEAALAILLWWRPARYWVMVLGILLHAGIDITMNIPAFGWVAVSFYIAFVDAGDLRKMWTWMLKPFLPLQVVPGLHGAASRSLDILRRAFRSADSQGADKREPGFGAAELVTAGAWAGLVVLVGLSAVAWLKPIDGYVSRSRALRNAEIRELSLLAAAGISDPWSLPCPDARTVPACSSDERQRLDRRTRYQSVQAGEAAKGEPTIGSSMPMTSVRPSEEVLRSLSRLASICWQEGDFEKCQRLNRYVWAERSRHKQYDPELLKTMRDLAGLYRDWSAFSTAERCYRAALSYENLYCESEPPESARDMANLALVEYLGGCNSLDSARRKSIFDSAVAHYENALSICAAHPDAGSTMTSTILANRAVVLQELKRQFETGWPQALAGSSRSRTQ